MSSKADWQKADRVQGCDLLDPSGQVVHTCTNPNDAEQLLRVVQWSAKSREERLRLIDDFERRSSNT